MRKPECTLAPLMVQPVVHGRDPRRALWTLLLAGLAVSLVVSVRLSTMSLVLGSEEGRWVYPYLAGFTRHAALVTTRVLVIAGLMAALPLGLVRRWQWPVVIAWLVVGFGLQAELRSLTRYSVQQMFESDGSNGFYTPTTQYRLDTLLRDGDRIRPTLPVHARSNMPGKLALVYGLEQVSSDPSVLPWLIIACSNLGGLLLYLFVRDLLADRVTALVALILYLFVPAKLYFFPVMNTVTPIVALLFMLVWLRWLQYQQARWAAAAGVLLYGLVFFEPLPLVLGLLLATLIVWAIAIGHLSWRTLVRHLPFGILGSLAVDAIMRAGMDFNLVRTLGGLMSDAVTFNETAQRPYGIWVVQNLFDFGFGMGVTQAVLLAAPIALAVRARQWTAPEFVFTAALAAVVLATDLLGVNRGEVPRLWIFLACLCQVPAAIVCARLESRAALMLVLGTSIIQGALGTAMMGFATP